MDEKYSNITKCGECSLEIRKLDDNLCNECEQFVEKYYCTECQLKHSCNKGLWESKADANAPKMEKLLKKFAQDFLIEHNLIINDLVVRNNKLKDKIKVLKEKLDDHKQNE